MPAPTEWEKRLEDALVRVQGAIARAQARHDQEVKAHGPPTGSPFDFNWFAAAGVVRQRRREARHRYREQRRAWKKQLKRQRAAKASSFKGYLFAVLAVLFLAQMTVAPQALWWMVFLSLGFGQASLRNFIGVRQREELEAEDRAQALPAAAARAAPAQSAPAIPATSTVSVVDSAIGERLKRIDALCDKILGELKTGRPVLRTVVQNPEQTVSALRTTCHELARREQELRALVTDADEERLCREREQLSLRIGKEKDEVVRARLGSALSLLDEQLRRRGELKTDAARLEAESTRLLYTLESLHTQVLRVRSADASSSELAGAGLRGSLEQLGQEIDAVAEALEHVNREELARAGVTPVSPISSEPLAADPRQRERS